VSESWSEHEFSFNRRLVVAGGVEKVAKVAATLEKVDEDGPNGENLLIVGVPIAVERGGLF
jgi:hypothetical protein